jgi:hypothetical protein
MKRYTPSFAKNRNRGIWHHLAFGEREKYRKQSEGEKRKEN